MALMALAAGAVDFGPGENQFEVRSCFDHLGIDRLPKAWPASAAIELVLRGKERQVAASTAVDSGLMILVHGVYKRPLSLLVPQDAIGFRGQELFPLFICLDDFDNWADVNLLRHGHAPLWSGLPRHESRKQHHPYIPIGYGARQQP